MKNTLKVLHADGSGRDRRLVRETLERIDGAFKVIGVSNREELETHLCGNGCDIVLTDYNVEGFADLEIIETIRKKAPGIPIVAIVGNSGGQTAARAMDAGVSDIVEKTPENMEALPEIIHAAVENNNRIASIAPTRNELLEQKHFLELVLDAIPAAIFFKSADGKNTGCNKMCEKLFGPPGDRTAGNDVFHVHSEGPSFRCDEMDRAMFRNPGKRQYETRILDAGGRVRDVRVHKTVCRDESGRIAGLAGAVVDITDEKNALVEKEKLEKRLRRKHRLESIGTLASGIAHDFNNILASIIGYAELAADDSEKGSIQEKNIEQIVKAGARARDLIKGILNFSGGTENVRKPLHINPMVKGVLKMLRAAIPESVEIRSQIADELLTVKSDPAHIDQIVINLCSNAALAMEETGGRMEVILEACRDSSWEKLPSCLGPGHYARLSVVDSGPGIDPWIVDKIFDPYFTTRRNGKGNGLGLSVVKDIVEAHGGAVTVHSKPGQGARFDVFLPLVAEMVDDPDIMKPEPTVFGRENILVVDDEIQSARMRERMFKKLGYGVAAKTDGSEALEIFKSTPGHFDLVVTDFTLPGMTGDRLLKELRRIRPDIPVVLCVDYGENIDEEKAMELGADLFLRKPVGKRRMARALRQVLD